MRTPLKVLRDGAVAELAGAMRREKRAVDQVRLRGVLAVARGDHVPAVARALSVAERAVRQWVHRYNAEGLDGLQDRRTGRQCRLSAAQQEQLQQRLRAGPTEADGVCSLRGQDVRRIVEKDFAVRYSRAGVYYLLHHQLGMSYLKPRPIHRKADPAAQEAFKKTSRRPSRKSVKSIPASGSKSGSRTRADSDSKGL